MVENNGFMPDYQDRDHLLKLLSQWENIGEIDHLKKGQCPLDMPVCVRSACPFFGEIGSDMSKEGPRSQLGCKKKYLKEIKELIEKDPTKKASGTNYVRGLVKENIKSYLDM